MWNYLIIRSQVCNWLGGVSVGRRNLIVAMDVGTSQVRVVVAEPRQDGTVGVIGAGLSPLKGSGKG